MGRKLRAVQRWEAGKGAPEASALTKLIELCPDEETRALFRSPSDAPRQRPIPLSSRKSIGEQWAHLAVEMIFERAPEAIHAKMIDLLEEWAGKYGTPRSPMKAVQAKESRANFSLDNAENESKIFATSQQEIAAATKESSQATSIRPNGRRVLKFKTRPKERK